MTAGVNSVCMAKVMRVTTTHKESKEWYLEGVISVKGQCVEWVERRRDDIQHLTEVFH